MKLLPYLFEKYIYIYIIALEMASPGNQHCASCIGTLSFPIKHRWFSAKITALLSVRVDIRL